MSGLIELSMAEARARAEAALVSAGTAPLAARSTAHALVLAEADGHGGHGLVRLSSYVAQVRAGKVHGQATPSLVVTRPAAATIDAAHGFAYPALDLAVDWLASAVPAQGIGIAGIRRSGHCGAMGLVVERLARHGLVTLMVANTPAAMAPWGGKRALFGTNPIACAMPDDPDPVVVDLSLSKVARGQILAARRRGDPIPEGWALGPDGAPTTDPESALRGTMVPMGEAKGAALALMVEALAGGLTGSNYAAEASSFLDDRGEPPSTGQLLIAIDPSVCGGSAGHLAHLFADVAAEDGARLPGLGRFARRRKAEAEGLLVDPVWFDTVS
jgi:(2R)-3-sulfolactate dehydrogenase (NADP+)